MGRRVTGMSEAVTYIGKRPIRSREKDAQAPGNLSAEELPCLSVEERIDYLVHQHVVFEAGSIEAMR